MIVPHRSLRDAQPAPTIKWDRTESLDSKKQFLVPVELWTSVKKLDAIIWLHGKDKEVKAMVACAVSTYG